MKKIIKPNKPILTPDFYLCIELKESQVDVSQIKEKALQEGYREQTYRHITIVSRKNVGKVLEKFNDKEKEKLLH